MKTAVIANPRSAGGRTGKRWGAWRQAIEKRFGAIECRFTGRSGHGSELAREFLLAGFERIIGVGGDGTFNEIANGFLNAEDRALRPGACLGIIPAGTGGDLQRTLRIPSGIEAALDALASGATLPVDLGKITFEAHHGGTQTRYFINVTSWGMGGEVSRDAKNRLQVFGGKTAFLWATVKNLLSYSGKRIDLTLDGKPAGSHTVLNIAVGNGLFHGGGMYVCPNAVLNDGLLEVTIIGNLGLPTLARDVRYLYNGNIAAHPKVRCYQAREIAATSPETVKIEVDGEPLGRLPVRVSVVPLAMRVIVPADSPLL